MPAPPLHGTLGTLGTLTALDRAALSIGLADAQTCRWVKTKGVYRWLRQLGVAPGRPLANERLEALRLFAFEYAGEDAPARVIQRASGVEAYQLQQARAYCADRLTTEEPSSTSWSGAPAVRTRDIPGWALALIMVIGLSLAVL